MYDSAARLPEANSIFGGRGCEKVVDLLVSLLCPLEIVAGSGLGLNQVVTVDRGGNSNLNKRGKREGGGEGGREREKVEGEGEECTNFQD